MLRPIIFSGIAAAIILSCSRDPFVETLEELDYEVSVCRQTDMPDPVNEWKVLAEVLTDSLKWEAAYTLFDRYMTSNTDSAIFYLDRMTDIYWYRGGEFEMRNKVCKARLFSITNPERLELTVSELQGLHFGEAFRPRYYSIMIDIYSRHTGLSSYAPHYIDFLESALSEGNYPRDTLLWYSGLRARVYNSTSDAIMYFTKTYDETESYELKGLSAEALSDIYKDLRNGYLTKEWLIRSSIHQLRASAGEQRSLYRLATILSEEGDYSRAARYINTVIQKASYSGFPNIVVQSAKNSLAVADSLDKIDRARYILLSCILGISIISLSIIFYLLIQKHRQNKSLVQVEKALTVSNNQLTDVNKIKDSYLIKYMNMSISYLGLVEEYRKKLRKTYKENGIESMLAELRMPTTSVGEYKDFYRTFDKIFLGLYPDFIERVNSRLSIEDRFAIKDSLNTPLRILAAIRLGFTESSDIARFLNCSPETVYTYRSRLKSKSVDKDLESYIKSII